MKDQMNSNHLDGINILRHPEGSLHWTFREKNNFEGELWCFCAITGLKLTLYPIAPNKL